MATHLPSGTVTFLLTDLEGSTRLWEQDPEPMRAAMVRHDELLEKAIAAHQGFVFARMGDGMAAAFTTAGDAVAAAIAIKSSLADEIWRTPTPLKARIGLHTAEAVIVDDSGYASLPINRCSRLMAAAHGGQIVVSGATEALVRANSCPMAPCCSISVSIGSATSGVPSPSSNSLTPTATRISRRCAAWMRFPETCQLR